MATKTIILAPSGITVPDIATDAYPTYPMPNDAASSCIVPWIGGVPADYSAMVSVEAIILTEHAGNLYLRGRTTRFDSAIPGPVDSSASAYAAYAGGTADSDSKFITLLSTMWSSLADINAGDVFNFIIDRDASNVLDTYETDLNVIGLRIIYTTGYVAGTHYCNQTDLEYRITTRTLAQLTNDTANATTPDANVLELILTNVDAIIDSKAGQVYTVPFTTVPDIIKNIAISLACYQVFQRRPVNMAMPKDWETAYKDASQQLEDISNMLLRLPDTALIASSESSMNTSDAVAKISFTDASADNLMQDY